jgi:tetratricopeptide (TPR) repeat protein
LRQHENNIYFTADGEVLILSKGELNYKGIHAEKIDFDIDQFIKSILQKNIKFDYYYPAVSSLVNILNTLQGFKQALDFIEKTVQVDKEFMGNFINFGKRLFAIGKVSEAEVCFTKLLEIDSENREVKEMFIQIKQLKK